MAEALSRRCYPIIVMASGVLMISACSRSQNPEVAPVVSLTTQAGGFRAETASLALECSRALQFRVLFKKNGNWLTLSPEQGLPSSITFELDNQPFASFTFAGAPSLQSGVSTPFGQADQVRVEAKDAANHVSLALDLSFPKDFPDTVIIASHLKNLRPSGSVAVGEFDQASLRVAAGVPRDAKDVLFWSLQGGGYIWGGDYVEPVRAGFSQDNYTGPKGKGNGGGIPFVDLWRPEMGVAVALLDPKPALAWVPVSADAQGMADVKVVTRPGVQLASGETYSPAPVMIAAHQLDFYNPVARYREVMDRLGVRVVRDFLPADYAPAWCTWGYVRTWTLPIILAKAEQMKAMGMKDFILDDGWFDLFGNWEPTPQKFPHGEADMTALIEKVHSLSLTFRLWWSPGSADPGSEVDRKHPDWFVLDKDGHREKASWNAYYLCPAYAPVREFTRGLVTRFVNDWSVDAFKLDGTDLNHAPLCFNPAHHHTRPGDSFEQWPALFQEISDTARAIRKDFRMEFCPCGITPTFQTISIFEQPTDSDPFDYQVTARVKFLKALLGPHSPVLQEYVGLKGFYEHPYGDQHVLRVDLYPRAIGTGEVPSSFSPVLAKPHAAWTAIYNAQRPAEGEYVNLYDIRWENPEGHVIRKGEKLYYGFFTQTPGQTYSGTVQLRGLNAGHYHVTDYVRGHPVQDVAGPTADLPVKFQDSLLLVAEPSAP